MSDPVLTLLIIAGGIAALLILILRFKLHAFLSLLVISILVGMALGMPASQVIKAVQDGMGGTLGFVAVVVGLGAMFGALLDITGGVRAIADSVLRWFGERHASWALGLVGFLVAIPVFFDVALIILMPLLYGLVRKTQKPILFYAIPLLAGLAVTHAFIPPTPGPIAVADLLGADLGMVIMVGALAGLPAMIIAGPLFAVFHSKYLQSALTGAATPGTITQTPDEAPDENPDGPTLGIGSALASVLLPLVLILAGTAATQWMPPSTVRDVLLFVGHPFVALIIGIFFVYILFGLGQGIAADKLRSVMGRTLEPAGIVVLVTGAGGAFKQILVVSGGGAALADAVSATALPAVVFAFVVAAIVRVAQGSATVAMLTAAGLTQPLVENANLDEWRTALIVIAIASGATVASHVNDSGFWLVSRYLEINEAETLKSWTVLSSLVGLTGFGVVLLLSAGG